MARKWKLKYGTLVCNVQVERAGRILSVKCEAGRIYEGEEFAKWCPSVLVEVPTAVIHSLPPPPPPPPARTVMREPSRPEVTPEVVEAARIDLRATMEKKHVEDPTPPPPPEPEREPEPTPEPVPESRSERKPKIKKRGR